jgi:hypothetical protein
MTEIADDAPIRLDVAARLARKIEALASKEGLDRPAFEVGESVDDLLRKLPMLRLNAAIYAQRKREADAELLRMTAQHITAIEARIAELASPPPPKLPDEYAVGTVYVAGYGSFVKIGFTSGPVEDRLAAITTPLPFNIYGTFPNVTRALERELHARFAHQRLNGEWFHRSADVAKWIKRKCPL